MFVKLARYIAFYIKVDSVDSEDNKPPTLTTLPNCQRHYAQTALNMLREIHNSSSIALLILLEILWRTQCCITSNAPSTRMTLWVHFGCFKLGLIVNHQCWIQGLLTGTEVINKWSLSQEIIERCLGELQTFITKWHQVVSCIIMGI